MTGRARRAERMPQIVVHVATRHAKLPRNRRDGTRFVREEIQKVPAKNHETTIPASAHAFGSGDPSIAG